VESLHKLLRITGSLEVLNCSHLGKLNENLTKDFFVSLGEAKTLRILNLNNSGQIKSAADLGKSVAFNAKKNGSLEQLFFESCELNYQNFV